MDIRTAKRLVGPVQDNLAKAITQSSWGLEEEGRLGLSVRKVAEALSEFAWREGFSGIKDAHVEGETCDYGKHMGVGVFATAERKETMRQWCYQFVEIAERVIEENRVLKKRLKRIESLAREEDDE